MGERAEIRWRVERRLNRKDFYFRPNEHRFMFCTKRYDTHEEAVADIVNMSLNISDPKEWLPAVSWKYTDWKPYELKLISWDSAGNQTVERRSLV